MKISEDLLQTIRNLNKPIIIAVSGFGGSGKTTLANMLSEKLNVPVVSIDSFNKGIDDYSNWELMDFARFSKEILTPFYGAINPIKYTHYSGESREKPKEIEIENNGVLIVEGVGIFRPELMEKYSFSLWIDCPIEEAVKRGKKRDREVWNNPKDELWEGIWKKNDLEYYKNFHPNELANTIIDNTK